jgi:hypothetical protein
MPLFGASFREVREGRLTEKGWWTRRLSRSERRGCRFARACVSRLDNVGFPPPQGLCGGRGFRVDRRRERRRSGPRFAHSGSVLSADRAYSSLRVYWQYLRVKGRRRVIRSRFRLEFVSSAALAFLVQLVGALLQAESWSRTAEELAVHHAVPTWVCARRTGGSRPFAVTVDRTAAAATATATATAAAETAEQSPASSEQRTG